MSWTKKNPRDLAGEPKRTMEAALRYLGRREYTALELTSRLRGRGADEEAINAALLYTRERGYQNDERAALSHIRARLQSAPRGRALLLRELKERGVESELAATLLEEHYPPKAEGEMMRRLLEKEPPPSYGNRQEEQKLWQKMARKLAAKGFDQYLISDIVSAWIDLEKME